MRRVCLRDVASLLPAAVCCLQFAAARVEASPWPREEGRLFVSTKANAFVADSADGLVRFERIDGDLYVEYGLTPRLTLASKLIYGDASFRNGEDVVQVGGLAETEAAVQFVAHRGQRDALSVRIAGATPTRFENGGRPGVFSDGVDAELRALYGRNLINRPVKVYATVEAGYRRRFGDGADQARADALIGIEPSGRFLALLEAQSRISLRNENPGGADYDVVVLQPSVAWRPTRRLAVQVGASFETAARNLEPGRGVFLSIWTEFGARR